MIKYLNIVILTIFILFFILNFIFIGFAGFYTLLIFLAAFYAGVNLVFVNLSYKQKLSVMAYLTYIVYGGAIICLGACGVFFFVGVVKISDEENTDNNGNLGKWMITFTFLFALQIIAFIFNAKYFKLFVLEEALR